MKSILLLILFTITTSIYSLETDNFDTNLTESEFIELKDDLLYVIKKDSTKRNFIPGNKKKIITESITYREGIFEYYLKVIQLSNIFGEGDPVPFYYETAITGEIKKLTKTEQNENMKADEYSVTISSTTQYTNEYYNYYGPKNTKSIANHFSNDNYTILFNRNNIKDIEKDNSLYFIGITRAFLREELENLTLDELGYLRNEFYARKGFIFRTNKMKSYFSKKTWFKPVTRDVKLTEVELENVYLIRAMEQEINFGKNISEVDQINKLYEIAQLRALTKDDIKDISPHKLPYLRNTFFAKKGFIFSVLRYKDYFESQNWYVGSRENVDNLLSDLDKKNINFIKSNENR